MAIKLNQFIKSVIKVEEPYNLNFVFLKPTALELVQIQSQTAQLYAKLSSEENKTEPMGDLLRYQVDTIRNYVTEITGFEDDDGKTITLTSDSNLTSMVERLPINLLGIVFGKFLESLFPSPEEKKS